MNTSTDNLPIPLAIEVIEFEIQANADKRHYIVQFSDETQQDISCDSLNFPLELMIWSWRINKGLTKDDYVTFGLKYSILNQGSLITDQLITKTLEAAKKQAVQFDDYLDSPDLKTQFKKFLKSEIQRYLHQETKERLIVKETTEGQIKVFNDNDFISVFFGFLFIFSSLWLIWGDASFLLSLGSSSNSDYFTSPEYIESVKRRTGIGDTITEPEMFRACMVMAQDRGMSYAEAYRRCYY